MAQPSAYEQYFLELVNRARLDPVGEAARQGIGLNDGLAAGTISTAAKQPLAFSPLLIDAADAHSAWMLATDTFSHTGANGSSPGYRMKAAGYSFTGSWSWGENIAITWGGSGKLQLSAASVASDGSSWTLNVLNGGSGDGSNWGVWAELRQCESGGNYQDNTGNGFYGAYQFTQQTWDSLGLSGIPSQASPSVQDDAAKRLQARDGWGPWPACSRKLGLS